MMSLRQRMIEDMQIRNLSVHTQKMLRPTGFTICAAFQQVAGIVEA